MRCDGTDPFLKKAKQNCDNCCLTFKGINGKKVLRKVIKRVSNCLFGDSSENVKENQ